jgi:hypothetical protein
MVLNSTPTLDSPIKSIGYSYMLEYSLASLPSTAVVTSATVSYDVTAVIAGHVGLDTPVPFQLQVSMHDGVDGQTTYANMFNSPTLDLPVQTILTPGLYTSDISDLSFLKTRSAHFPGGYMALNFTDVGYFYTRGEISLSSSTPVVTINYTLAPEPASLGSLGVGMLMLLRRRR